MDYIDLGGSRVVDGLGLMLEAALGTHGYTDTRLVDVPTALLIIEIAKIAEDRDEWFPCGKWATIQAIQVRVDKELKTLFGSLKGHESERMFHSPGTPLRRGDHGQQKTGWCR